MFAGGMGGGTQLWGEVERIRGWGQSSAYVFGICLECVLRTDGEESCGEAR